ncbi:alpha/beta hydrolase [Algibacter sp.]|nr:alpha/beta hydrolase [Algibacter sp.]
MIIFIVITSFRADSENWTFRDNITYGIIDSTELQLNIAWPKITTKNSINKYPLIIFIHGGGWREGHRNAYNNQIKAAAERGYVGVTISHRLTSVVDKDGKTAYPWPASIHDSKAAVRFLKANADKFHIDTCNIGITGSSSGGHLALMVGLTNNTPSLDGTVRVVGIDNNTSKSKISSKVHAVVNISGPTEMFSCHKAPKVTSYFEYLLGGSPLINPDAYLQSSPIQYVTKNTLPIMTIHGKNDDVVPFEQALILDAKIRAAGGVHNLYALENQGHIFNGNAEKESWTALYNFFDKHLKQGRD